VAAHGGADNGKRCYPTQDEACRDRTRGLGCRLLSALLRGVLRYKSVRFVLSVGSATRGDHSTSRTSDPSLMSVDVPIGNRNPRTPKVALPKLATDSAAGGALQTAVISGDKSPSHQLGAQGAPPGYYDQPDSGRITHHSERAVLLPNIGSQIGGFTLPRRSGA
jgi:hypothetical protein